MSLLASLLTTVVRAGIVWCTVVRCLSQDRVSRKLDTPPFVPSQRINADSQRQLQCRPDDDTNKTRPHGHNSKRGNTYNNNSRMDFNRNDDGGGGRSYRAQVRSPGPGVTSPWTPNADRDDSDDGRGPAGGGAGTPWSESLMSKPSAAAPVAMPDVDGWDYVCHEAYQRELVQLLLASSAPWDTAAASSSSRPAAAAAGSTPSGRRRGNDDGARVDASATPRNARKTVSSECKCLVM